MSSIVPDVIVGNVGTTITVQITKPNPALSFADYIKGGATDRITVDIGAATLLEIEFEKPKGQRIKVVGEIKNPPGTDGRIVHTDSTGIFDVKGTWQCRGIATFGSLQKFTGTWSLFITGEN